MGKQNILRSECSVSDSSSTSVDHLKEKCSTSSFHILGFLKTVTSFYGLILWKSFLWAKILENKPYWYLRLRSDWQEVIIFTMLNIILKARRLPREFWGSFLFKAVISFYTCLHPLRFEHRFSTFFFSLNRWNLWYWEYFLNLKIIKLSSRHIGPHANIVAHKRTRQLEINTHLCLSGAKKCIIFEYGTNM